MQAFECHYSFKVIAQTHGRDEEGACENIKKFLDDDFVKNASNALQSVVDYDIQSVKEIENGWFELEIFWSSFWSIDATNKEEAKNIAENWLDQFLTPVYQSLENLSTNTRRFQFVDLKDEEVFDVVE